jgi:hypothetical protein
VVKEAARAVSERDDRLLAEKLEALENANKEVCDGVRGRGAGKEIIVEAEVLKGLLQA